MFSQTLKNKLSSLFLTHKRISCLFYFATVSKRDQLVQLSKEMPNFPQKYTSIINVKILHALVMAPYSKDMKGCEPIPLQDQLVYACYSKITSELHLLSHADINQLLQVMSHREETYNRNRLICRSIFKNLSKSFAQKCDPFETHKTLRLLLKLKYPAHLLTKMLGSLVNDTNTEKHLFYEFTNMQKLKIIMFILDQPIFSMNLIEKYLGHIAKINLDKLIELSYLYGILLSLEDSLKRKIQYHVKRDNAKKVLYDPESQELATIDIEKEPTTSKSSPPVDEEPEIIQSERNRIKATLQTLSQKIVKQLKEMLDRQKLQKSIIKSVESNIEPLSKQILILISSISGLRQHVDEFLEEKYTQLTPAEFIALNINATPANFTKNYNAYFQKLFPIMGLQDKGFLYLAGNRYASLPITGKMIRQMVENAQSISWIEFKYVKQLLERASQLEPADIQVILERVERLIDEK